MTPPVVHMHNVKQEATLLCTYTLTSTLDRSISSPDPERGEKDGLKKPVKGSVFDSGRETVAVQNVFQKDGPASDGLESRPHARASALIMFTCRRR